jgi:hypothetical protein
MQQPGRRRRSGQLRESITPSKINRALLETSRRLILHILEAFRVREETITVLDSNRLLHAILDQMLQLLPSDPAAVKRLDDMSDGELADGEAASERRDMQSSSIPSSAVVAKGGVARKLRAVS